MGAHHSGEPGAAQALKRRPSRIRRHRQHLQRVIAPTSLTLSMTRVDRDFHAHSGDLGSGAHFLQREHLHL